MSGRVCQFFFSAALFKRFRSQHVRWQLLSTLRAASDDGEQGRSSDACGVPAFLGSSSELLEESVLNKLAAKTAPDTGSAEVDPKVHVELLFVPLSKPVKTLKLGHAVYEDASASCASGRSSRFENVQRSEEHREEADELTGIACSIHYGGQAFVRENKTFSRANWSFRRIPATPAQARAALDWFKQRQGDGFNKAGFFTEPARRAAKRYVSCVPNVFHPQSLLQGKTSRWFCSELCEAGLRESGILTELTRSPHPEQFFQEIRNSTTPAAPVEQRNSRNTMHF